MLKNIGLLIVSSIFTLMIIEVGLRLFTVFPLHDQMANRVFDPTLGYRMDPSFPEIDSNGFRNSEVLAQADIVTIGDSHTYGYNVRSEESWPQQLANMSQKIVYNI